MSPKTERNSVSLQLVAPTPQNIILNLKEAIQINHGWPITINTKKKKSKDKSDTKFAKVLTESPDVEIKLI